MSEIQVDEKVAKALVHSFLQRLVKDGFVLTSAISDIDKQAIRFFVQTDFPAQASTLQPGVTKEEPARQAPIEPKVPRRALDFSCLEAAPSLDVVVGVDFGTAYSKASIWAQYEDHPRPLELLTSAIGTKGLLLDSTLYISEQDNRLYFGPTAIEVSMKEDHPARRRFDSPKQVLSIETIEALHSRTERDIDPTQLFTKRELLTLYLAYLSAMISDKLRLMGVESHALRRFAVPVWKESQVAETSRMLRQMLLDAQIIADSVALDDWKRGLGVEDAKAILTELRSALLDADPRRANARFIDRHVLEASAAAAAVGEQLINRRPVALVMDVGAGTTDIGLYYFVFPDGASEIQPKVAPFANGALNKKIAGDRLDGLLFDFISHKGKLNAADPVAFRAKRDIRLIKRDLFLKRAIQIEGIDDVQISLDEFIGSRPVRDYSAALRAAIVELVNRVGPDAIKGEDGLFAVLTGGGASSAIFDTFFDQPFEVSGGKVTFRPKAAEPEWLAAIDPAYVQIFPQLAVAFGVSAPNLPDEKRPISSIPNVGARVIGLASTYKS